MNLPFLQTISIPICYINSTTKLQHSGKQVTYLDIFMTLRESRWQQYARAPIAPLK